ncbi:hypothetical protein [Candidatus Nitrosotenuis cloacae]|uniref:hypothetical protein n=1 Tax=Candidatus Nitrosotenuis cloacae TaxID=1603555 RepID=UPI00227FDCCB|nr:hypothetical protein [Candidatus Nitrosotenuis cloacae]
MSDKEIEFLDSTKELINDFVISDLISDLLIKCTKNQINKNNYESNFGKFLPCIQNKVLRLSIETPASFTAKKGLLANKTNEIDLPSIINLETITNALTSGYSYIKDIIEKFANEEDIAEDDIDGFKKISITVVLVIIARANLQQKFSR